jgi:Flp pilus assembly protein TadD
VAANNLAWILSQPGGDKEKALSLAQLAKEVAPDDPSISDTLGWILYQRGVYQQALGHLRASAEKLPKNAEVRYHLGMAYLRAGDSAAARRELTEALALSGSFPGAGEAREALAGIR